MNSACFGILITQQHPGHRAAAGGCRWLQSLLVDPSRHGGEVDDATFPVLAVSTVFPSVAVLTIVFAVPVAIPVQTAV